MSVLLAVAVLPVGNLEAAQFGAQELADWATTSISSSASNRKTTGPLMFEVPLALTQEEHGQEEAEEEEEAEVRNEIALIIAGTYEDLGSEETENFFTIGGKYQREITSVIAVAGAFEYLHHKPAALLTFPVHFRLWKRLDVYAGPGVEFSEEHEHDEGDEEENHHAGEDGDSASWEATFLVRVGVGWLFEIGERYSLSPGVALDFIGQEQALVYGAEFSIKF